MEFITLQKQQQQKCFTKSVSLLTNKTKQYKYFTHYSILYTTIYCRQFPTNMPHWREFSLEAEKSIRPQFKNGSPITEVTWNMLSLDATGEFSFAQQAKLSFSLLGYQLRK